MDYIASTMNHKIDLRIANRLMILAILMFNPAAGKAKLVLKNLVQQFEEQSVEVQAANDLLKVVRLQWWDGLAEFSPKVDVQVGKTWYSESNDEFLSVGKKPSDIQTTITVQESLWNNGLTLDKMRVASIRESMQVLKVSDSVNQMILDLIYAYYDYRFSVVNVQIAAVEKINKKKTQDRGEELYKIGKMNRLDYLSAALAYEKAKLDLENDTYASHLAWMKLQDFIPRVDLSPALFTQTDIERRPYYFTLYQNKSLADFSLFHQEGGYEPQMQVYQGQLLAVASQRSWLNLMPGLYLTGSYTRDYSAFFNGQDQPQAQDNWAMALQMTWNLFDGFTQYRDYQRKRIELGTHIRQGVINQKQERWRLKKYFYDVKDQEIKEKYEKKMIELAQSKLQLVREQFESGMVSVNDLNEAELVFKKMQIDKLSRIVAYFKSIALLLKMSGYALSAVKNQPAVGGD